MRVPRDHAHAVAAARKKMRTVYAGEGILVIPLMDGVAYHSTHWLPDPARKSVQCTGADCPYHHLDEIQKMHVPCLVNVRRMKYDEAMAFKPDSDPEYVPSRWIKQIVEVTEGCFAVAEKAHAAGTPAIIARKPGKKNNALEFKWLQDCNISVPPEDRFTVDTALPLIIEKVYRTGRQIVGLDSDTAGRTKHNSNVKSLGLVDGIGGAL